MIPVCRLISRNDNKKKLFNCTIAWHPNINCGIKKRLGIESRTIRSSKFFACRWSFVMEKNPEIGEKCIKFVVFDFFPLKRTTMMMTTKTPMIKIYTQHVFWTKFRNELRVDKNAFYRERKRQDNKNEKTWHGQQTKRSEKNFYNQSIEGTIVSLSL